MEYQSAHGFNTELTAGVTEIRIALCPSLRQAGQFSIAWYVQHKASVITPCCYHQPDSSSHLGN